MAALAAGRIEILGYEVDRSSWYPVGMPVEVKDIVNVVKELDGGDLFSSISSSKYQC